MLPRQVMFRCRGDSQHVLSLCQRPRWQRRESHPEIRRMWRRKPTCEGPYMDTFALAGSQNILWLVQWCRCLSGEPSARPRGAVTLLSNLHGTQEICAVGVARKAADKFANMHRQMQQWLLQCDRASQDDNGAGAGRTTRRCSKPTQDTLPALLMVPEHGN